MKLKELLGKNAYVCNLLVLLSILTVFEHFVELCTTNSGVSKGLFLFIFFLHMPLLVFMSGALFKKIEEDKSLILKLAFSSFGLYLLMRLVTRVGKFFLGNKLPLPILPESEMGWIFFSFAIYLLLTYCIKYFDKRMILAAAFVLAVLCGYNEAIGNLFASFTVSRTIIFFPFFILGWMYGIDTAERVADKKSFRLLGLCILVLTLFVSVFFIRKIDFLISFFVKGNVYALLNEKPIYGPIYRVLAYAFGAVLMVAVLAVTPRRSLGRFFDKIGERFVQIYFLHCPFLYILMGTNVYDLLNQTFGRRLGRIFWVVCALACVVVLSANIWGFISKKSVYLEKRLLRSNAIRIGAFICIGIVILNGVHNVIVRRAGDSRISQWYGSFYDQKKDSLDAVFIGSSATYSSWLPTFAWDQYGIAVSLFTCPNQSLEAAEYLIKEIRKTQPNALYIIQVRDVGRSLTSNKLHYMTDNMPFSWNKIQTVRAIGGYMGKNWEEQLEYLFPLIRFHSRWPSLSKNDFSWRLNGFNGNSSYSTFLRNSKSVSSSYLVTEETVAISEITQDALESLLEYCDAERLNVLFVQSPSAISKERQIYINTVKEIIRAYGYPVLDLQPAVEEIGLNLEKDYYNAPHVNIHGAIKTTDYISRYLIENYGFEDKHGDPAYSTWDKAHTSYTEKYASAYTLDVEWAGEPRDNTLAAPALETAEAEQGIITVSWDAIPGADGYRVYRKDARGNSWQIVDTVGANTLSCDDPDRRAGRTYYYTAIAYREEDGVRYWGDYKYSGVTIEVKENISDIQTIAE